MASRDEEFLSRWSRRKLEARRKSQADETTEDQTAGTSNAEEGQAEAETDNQSQQAHLNQNEQSPGEETETTPTALEDVDFDALDYNSDYTRFMDKAVPEAIRQKALRKLWASDPILANLDGLNEYDEDFTFAGEITKMVQSAYEPGRGYVMEEDVEEDEAEVADETQDPEAIKKAASEDDDKEVQETSQASTEEPSPTNEEEGVTNPKDPAQSADHGPTNKKA